MTRLGATVASVTPGLSPSVGPLVPQTSGRATYQPRHAAKRHVHKALSVDGNVAWCECGLMWSTS